ncbi:MAG: HEAT repeat domain-containing protein [candidate division WOR-3 bacterium]|nr:MAG: HEAT repeat domain-containing protein [candidate division WOR-3 bacterium]
MIFLVFLLSQHVDYVDLYNKATTSLVTFQTQRDSAVQTFIELGLDSLLGNTTVRFLVSKFDTKSSLERHTIKNILKEIGTSAIKEILDQIDYRGSDEESRSLKQSLWVLGEIGGSEIVEPVARFIDDSQWQIRSGAHTALGNSQSEAALPPIIRGLTDSVSVVRKSAFYALSQIATEAELHYLIEGLDDEFYGVRYAAAEGLKKLGSIVVQPLVEAISSNEVRNYFIVEVLKHISAEDQLKLPITAESPAVRYNIYRAMDNTNFLKDLLQYETHPLLKTFLEVKTK